MDDEDEFLRLIRAIDNNDSEDCPEDLIKLATTPFERVVCVEFFKLYKDFQAYKAQQNTNMSWLKWLVTAVLTTGAVTFIFELVKTLVYHL